MIGQKQEIWVNENLRSFDKGKLDILLSRIDQSIYKWVLIVKSLKRLEIGSCDYSQFDDETIVQAINQCGLCIFFCRVVTPFSVECRKCPLKIDKDRCFDRDPYRKIYETIDATEPWELKKHQIEEIGEYATGLIEYLGELTRAIKVHAW